MADSYDVTGQERTFVKDATGRAVRGVVVTFRSKQTDVVDSVEIPDGHYTAEKVDAAIRERVAVADAVAKL